MDIDKMKSLVSAGKMGRRDFIPTAEIIDLCEPIVSYRLI